jgi:glycerol-3-phosphate O-acyltransferase
MKESPSREDFDREIADSIESALGEDRVTARPRREIHLVDVPSSVVFTPSSRESASKQALDGVQRPPPPPTGPAPSGPDASVRADTKDTKDTKDAKDTKDTKDTKDAKDAKDVTTRRLGATAAAGAPLVIESSGEAQAGEGKTGESTLAPFPVTSGRRNGAPLEDPSRVHEKVQVPDPKPVTSAQVSRSRSLDPPEQEKGQHPREMLHRFGFVGWLLGKLIFSRVFFPNESIERIRDASKEGTIVYVLRLRSTLNFMFFNYAFMAHGLPVARFANGLRTIFWQPFKLLLRRLFGRRAPEPVQILRKLTQQGHSSAVFLKSHAVIGTKDFDGPYLRTLIEMQKESDKPIVVVPLTVLWGARNVRDVPSRISRFPIISRLLGNQDEPRPLRRWLRAFRLSRRSLAVACEPLRLDQFIQLHSNLAAQDAQTGLHPLSDKLEAELLDRIEGERRVRVGPRRAHFLQIRNRILQAPEIRALIHQRADELNRSVASQERWAQKTLKKMQAQMSSRGLGRIKWIIDQIWKRIFKGFEIDEAGLAKLPEVGLAGPLLFVPTHRSHIDYLVLSDLLVTRKQLPPHIAAGINLSFWPMGWLFRTSGAFFIRRRFQGNALYSALLRAYVAELLREGHYLEVFIEGGRSRTGRVLHPKLGLLSVVADLTASGEVPPVHVVPISIGYERLTELKSVTRELVGGKKKPESVKGILKATKVLRSNGAYGWVNVQFAAPINMKTFLAERGFADETASPEARRKAIRSLGYHTLSRAGAVTAVTGTSLVAAGVLARGTSGVRRPLLKQAIELFGVVAQSSGARFVTGVLENDRVLDDEGLDHAVEILIGDEALEVSGQDDERVYVSRGEARVRLEYYKNLMLQHLMGPALVSIVMRAMQGPKESQGDRAERPPVPLADLKEACLFVLSLMRLHFVMNAGKKPEGIIDSWITQITELELIHIEAEQVYTDPGCVASLDLLAGTLESTVEAYSACAKTLYHILRGGTRRRKELEEHLLDELNRLHLTGELRRFESCQTPLVKVVIDWLCEEGILTQSTDGEDIKVGLARHHTDGAALEALVQRAEALLMSH